MTVGNVIYYALIMCGKEDVANLVLSGGIPDDNAEIVRMLNCYNLTVLELSEQVEPLVTTEEATSADGVYPFTALSKPVKEVLDVTADGKRVKFVVKADGIVTDVGRCEITYDYRAKKATSLSDAIEYEEKVFSPRVLAMGTASEYLLISGLYDECMAWRKRYEDAVELRVLGKSGTVKARRWA